MLNIGELAAGGEDYYLATVARSVESYYLGKGEAPGRWIGRGLEPLGLSGTVSGDDLRAVLGGADPSTGDRLTARPNRRVPGFDLAFRPPKSVSIALALSDEQTSMTIRQAHDRAVQAAIGFLEDELIRSRRGRNGVEQVQVNGVVAAAFRHRTSRNNDPLLAHPRRRRQPRPSDRRRPVAHAGLPEPVPVGQDRRVRLPGATAPRAHDGCPGSRGWFLAWQVNEQGD